MAVLAIFLLFLLTPFITAVDEASRITVWPCQPTPRCIGWCVYVFMTTTTPCPRYTSRTSTEMTTYSCTTYSSSFWACLASPVTSTPPITSNALSAWTTLVPSTTMSVGGLSVKHPFSSPNPATTVIPISGDLTWPFTEPVIPYTTDFDHSEIASPRPSASKSILSNNSIDIGGEECDRVYWDPKTGSQGLSCSSTNKCGFTESKDFGNLWCFPGRDTCYLDPSRSWFGCCGVGALWGQSSHLTCDEVTRCYDYNHPAPLPDLCKEGKSPCLLEAGWVPGRPEIPYELRWYATPANCIPGSLNWIHSNKERPYCATYVLTHSSNSMTATYSRLSCAETKVPTVTVKDQHSSKWISNMMTQYQSATVVYSLDPPVHKEVTVIEPAPAKKTGGAVKVDGKMSALGALGGVFWALMGL